ncbi:ATP-binding protein [Thermococcus gammatolerans]|uniref:ATPase of the AAA superfamily, putative n=1 Tax=Thermococcus gammatolerans (strain DSM 15229 / JCM 11827 / EJ3) TaxID=593117 RepID=C5A2E7_THEGJ|nr:ATP-binding protein [Thermococcus gammatolerans]ACS34566.1 ATPase of the AAA superfamily, putative [Thermococcus gammatolerans EJ3]
MLTREEIVEVLAPYNLWGGRKWNAIPRDEYLSEIERKLSAGVVALVGTRRSGKTTLAGLFLKKAIDDGLPPEGTLYVNLEDPRFSPYLSPEFLEEVFSAYRTYVYDGDGPIVVLDEVQNVPGWEKWVRKVLDLSEARVIVTGSTSSLLRSELSTLLTGRVLPVEVYPLSFREFLIFRGFSADFKRLLGKRRKVEALMREYLEFGGFPQVVLTEDDALKLELLRELFEGIVLRDIVYRHGFRDARAVKIVAELALSRFSSLVSVSRLRNELAGILSRKVSPNFVDGVLDAMDEAYLSFRVPILSPKVKDAMHYPKKMYAIDTGIANIVGIHFTGNIGRLAENAVARHLRQRFREVYYYRGKGEVDFIVKEGLRVTRAVQVTWDIDESWEREVEGLLEAMDVFGLKEGVIVTGWRSCEERFGEKTVKCVPLWRFLIWLWNL